ncbi:MAG: 1-acyl-sn-glycerol-3-phosphate acyltransferase [Syntrophobacterales bacterium]|nr:MAG: 1-acyl-sn-glycerol-3-phosphate acyltransferase [Syntrophobacterales bacterium]
MDILVRICKVLWTGFWAGLALLLVFIPIVVAASLSSTGNLAFTISRAWAWIMLKVTGVRPEIRGREKIRPGQSYVIISNHQSHFDILALVIRLGIQFRWIIKKELRAIPLFGFALYKSKNIFIDLTDRDKAVQSIREGIRHLPPGVSVLFFAEGTRSPDGAIQPFKKGGFTTAVEGGLPILPVTVNGSRKVLPKGALAFKRGPIEVVVGDTVDTRSCAHATIEELIAVTRSTIIVNFNPDYPEERTS